MQKICTKASPRLTLFFLSNQVTFMGQNYGKQKETRTSDQSLFRLQSKFRKIPVLVMYYLTKFDDPKIKPANLCKPTHDILNYSTFICPFESGMWKGKKL